VNLFGNRSFSGIIFYYWSRLDRLFSLDDSPLKLQTPPSEDINGFVVPWRQNIPDTDSDDDWEVKLP